MKWRGIKVVGMLLIAAISLYCLDLAIPRHDYFIERVGTPDVVSQTESSTATAIRETVQLRSATGLEVDLRVLRPAAIDDEKLPLVLLIGGHQTGKDAVDLVREPDGIAYAAIDYPYTGEKDLDGVWQSIAAVPKIQEAFLDAPPALSLALSWALEQSWIDERQIELVGVSLGVPFAAVAGAVDTRFTRVWLLHGGADNLSWVANAGRKRIKNATLRNIAARTALFLVHGNSFDTAKWMHEIAPRPLIIVAACDDDYVPPESQQAFIDAAAGEFVELIWTDGLHIDPRRPDELQQLIDIVTNRIRGYAAWQQTVCGRSAPP